MAMPAAPDRNEDARVAAQRRRAVRTALWLAAVAVAVYVLFILSGVLAS